MGTGVPNIVGRGVLSCARSSSKKKSSSLMRPSLLLLFDLDLLLFRLTPELLLPFSPFDLSLLLRFRFPPKGFSPPRDFLRAVRAASSATIPCGDGDGVVASRDDLRSRNTL